MKNYYQKTTLSLMMAAVILLPSCASIFSKSTYPLSINSSPTKATISIVDKNGIEFYRGTTPAIVKLKSGAGYFKSARYMVHFSSPGYESRTLPIMFKIDGWYFGNILIGGLLGMLIIDPITGAMWTVDSDYLHATLDELPGNKSDKSGLNVVDINDIPEDMKNHLVRVN